MTDNLIPNSLYIDALRMKGTDADRQLLPSATHNGVNGFMDALYPDKFSMLPDEGMFNKFTGLLSRASAQMLVHSWRWDNPFQIFRQRLTNGSGFLVSAVEALDGGENYDSRKSDLLVRDYGNVKQFYIPVNYEIKKTISINETDLRESILSEGELSSFVQARVDGLANFDAIRTYNRMKATLGHALLQPNFSNVHLDIADPLNPTKAELNNFSRLLRIIADYMKVAPSADFNAAHVTTTTPESNLVVFVSPVLKESLTVNVLADAFNRGDREIQPPIIMLDHMPYNGVYAVVADRNMLKEGTLSQGIQSMPYDPSTQSFNMTLVHRSAIGWDPFCNAVAISASPNTVREVVDVVPPSKFTMDVTDETGTSVTTVVPHAGHYFVDVNALDGSITPTDHRVKTPTGATYDVSAPDDPTAINSRTYVDVFGHLHFQKHIEDGTVLVITAHVNASENPDATIDDARKYTPTIVTTKVTVSSTDGPTPPDNGPKLVALTIGGVDTLALGATSKLVAQGAYSDGTAKDLTDQVSWTASADGCLSIDKSGTVAALKAGDGYISATVDGVVAPPRRITVTAPTLSSIAVAPKTGAATVGVGKTLQLAVTGTYSDKTTKDLTADATFTSSDESLVKVDAKGVATGVKAGKPTVTAKADGATSAALTVEVTA